MPQENEYQPRDPAPQDGQYEALNVLCRAIGRVVEATEGDAPPDLSRGFTWRRITRAST
jgi:hypothetical protein